MRANPRSIVFPEGDDPRILEAVLRLVADGLIGRAVLIGDRGRIERVSGAGTSPDGRISVADTDALSSDARYREECRRARGLGALEGEILDRTMRIRFPGGADAPPGGVDGFIGGVRTTTAEILRTGIGIVRADRRVGVVTSFSIVTVDGDGSPEGGIYVIADPVVNPDPTAGVLCKIAEAAAAFSRQFLGIRPRIAFLSYSTRGSGVGKSVDKMRVAAERAREKMPEIVVDGELQPTPLSRPRSRTRKRRGAPSGKGERAVVSQSRQREHRCKADPVLRQRTRDRTGHLRLGRPYNDISRAATVEDIVNLALITQLQS